jgi:hypothetical protein
MLVTVRARIYKKHEFLSFREYWEFIKKLLVCLKLPRKLSN